MVEAGDLVLHRLRKRLRQIAATLGIGRGLDEDVSARAKARASVQSDAFSDVGVIADACSGARGDGERGRDLPRPPLPASRASAGDQPTTIAGPRLLRPRQPMTPQRFKRQLTLLVGAAGLGGMKAPAIAQALREWIAGDINPEGQ